MATGAIDATGIYRYGEDDPLYPFSEFLNRLAVSVSDTLSAPWTAVTPALTGVTIGNGTVAGRQRKLGRTVHTRGRFVLGSTSAVTGFPQITLPYPTVAVTAQDPLGTALLVDSSAGQRQPAVVYLWSASSARISGVSGAPIAATVPFTWAEGDSIGWNLTYETNA